MFLSFLEVAPHPVSIDIMGVEIGSVPDPDDAVIAQSEVGRGAVVTNNLEAHVVVWRLCRGDK